jgi:hypothetical protein
MGIGQTLLAISPLFILQVYVDDLIGRYTPHTSSVFPIFVFRCVSNKGGTYSEGVEENIWTEER